MLRSLHNLIRDSTVLSALTHNVKSLEAPVCTLKSKVLDIDEIFFFGTVINIFIH